MTSRTDAIKAALLAELEARRAQIDGDDGLASIAVIVKFDQKTSMPLDKPPIWRTESQRRVGPKLPGQATRAHFMSYGS